MSHYPDTGGDATSRPLNNLADLSPKHLEMLRASVISDETIQDRGYRTVTRKVDLKGLGFKGAQHNVPALLIPIHLVAGGVGNYQSRPDEPRIGENGKVVKYEMPSGSSMVIDVPPASRPLLADPSRPLYITEGVKKGDALASAGCCAISLLGVWNWRGTNGYGGKTTLPDWESIALNSREVFIVFDSDVMRNVQVHSALTRLKAFLESRGVIVKVTYLPDAEDGRKQGVDDYLAAGGTVEELSELAETDIRPLPEEEENLAHPYHETDQGLVWVRNTPNGPIEVQLTNFIARIVADVIEDDGAEETRHFEIEANLRDRAHRFTVPADVFVMMNWVSENLGAGAIVYPGFSLKDHARTAIQILSGEVPTKTVYGHTGWRKVDGLWLYLHSGGAIGPEGPLSGIETDLSEVRLRDFSFEDEPTPAGTLEAVRASLHIMDVAPLHITGPLLASVYRAPLGDVVTLDLSLLVAGPTGTRKSELTALVQAHFGRRFNGRNLPGNWSSTANALEKLTFTLKDAVCVIDDFAPVGTSGDIDRLHRDADRLFRASGNNSGRGRMQADMKLRTVFSPRSLIVSSGEDTPRGQSLRARMLVLDLAPGDVDLDVLSELQEAAASGLFESAMAAYLKWLAPRLDDLRERLPERRRKLRAEAAEASGHSRTPDNAASLKIGLETFLEFAVEVGTLDEEEAVKLDERLWEAILTSARDQAGHLLGEAPAQRFLSLLGSALTGGYAHLARRQDNQPPENPERWGWRPRSGDTDTEWTPKGPLIGWLDDDGSILVEPGGVYATVQDLSRRQGGTFEISQQTLWKRLREAGYLASRDDARGRNTTRRKVLGERKNVIHLIAGLLTLAGETGPSGPSGPREDDEDTEEGEGSDNSPSLPPPRTAVLVDTLTDLEELIVALRAAPKIGLDLETTGLDPRTDKVRLLTVATEKGTWIVDCFSLDPSPIFPVLAEKTLLIHNALFDLGFLNALGFEPGEKTEVIDTMLLSQIAESHEGGLK